MSDIPPKNPLFDKAPGRAPDKPRDSIANPEEAKQVEELKKDLENLRSKFEHRGRAEQFLPYILVRSVLGDRGDRPINVPFWESPDIWTAAGDPSTTPSVPATPGGTVAVGAPNTVYAHVWNLGRAPIAGVKVEFYWFDPSLVDSLPQNHAHLIGMTRVDLGPRSSPDCHKLVKCPKAWVPVFKLGGESLVVRASSIGDTINPVHAWDPWAERHVAGQSISVLRTAPQTATLISTILANTKPGTRVQVVQVGEQARLVMQLMAPTLRLDPRVKTDVLAELQSDGSLMVVAPSRQSPGALAPIHTLSGMAQPDMETHAILEVPRINLAPFIGREQEMKSSAQEVTGGRESRIARDATPVDLLRYERFLPNPLKSKLTHLSAPQSGVGQVLRFVGYTGDQLVGGYTVVVTA
jgi:hypothetical protein